MFCDVPTYNALDLEDFFDAPLKQPDTCPFCKKAVMPHPLMGIFHQRSSNTVVNAFFLCPSCENIFIGVYFSSLTAKATEYFYLHHCLPEKVYVDGFSDNIEELSPRFVEIYQQSQKAENAGLHEICGMGYRKALEFLVKDYAIYRNPDKAETIASQMLSPCINEYIDNRRIKTLAIASAWIGNDETHYIRKNEDYNVEHLKSFISAIETFIDSDLEVDKAEELVTKK